MVSSARVHTSRRVADARPIGSVGSRPHGVEHQAGTARIPRRPSKVFWFTKSQSIHPSHTGSRSPMLQAGRHAGSTRRSSRVVDLKDPGITGRDGPVGDDEHLGASPRGVPQ